MHSHDPDVIWNQMASCIRRVTEDIFSDSRGDAPPCKGKSWWKEEVKIAIKIKWNFCRDLRKNNDGISF